MNAAHLHLLLNHFPLIGFIFSAAFLLCGLFRANESLVRAGLFIVLFSGALGLPTYLSGEPAEKIIEHSAGFSEALVEVHEDAALFAICFIGLTTFVAAAGVFLSIKKNRTPKNLLIGIIALNLFTLTVIARTSYLGGQISHPEIRDDHK